MPQRGTSNEYQNICFHGEIFSIDTFLVEKKGHIKSYMYVYLDENYAVRSGPGCSKHR